MTIFHKSMLLGAVAIAEVEDDPQLTQVLLEPTGEVVAINKWALYVASPSVPVVVKSLPLNDTALNEAVGVSVTQIEELCRSIPSDRQFKSLLEHVSVVTDTGNVLKTAFNNGRGLQHVTLRAGQIGNALATWRARFKELGTTVHNSSINFLFNRARLKSVVAAIEVSCKYHGEFDSVVQRPFSNGYVWLARNGQTQQSITIAWVMPTGNPELTFWEKNLLGIASIKKPLTRPSR